MNDHKKPAARAFRNAVLTLGGGVLAILAYVSGQGLLYEAGRIEVGMSPVLAPISVCDGRVNPDTLECSGAVVVFDAFTQTDALCDGRDAIVMGVMSKVRENAVYIDGRQAIFFGDPAGRFRRAMFEFEDQQSDVPSNRPAGVQEWGPWRLRGGCVTEFATWFTTVEHRPMHGLWPLPSTLGPFPLPRAQVEGQPGAGL